MTAYADAVRDAADDHLERRVENREDRRQESAEARGDRFDLTHWHHPEGWREP